MPHPIAISRRQPAQPATLPADAAPFARCFGAFALLALVLAGYWPTLAGGFVSDDVTVILQGSLVQARDGWWRFWLTNQAVDYWPLWSSGLWLQWHLWGAQPLPYHIVNLSLHGVCVLELWAILRRLSGVLPGTAWGVAALFAVHPVGVEAVAWIIQSKTLLAASCALGCLLCYQRFWRDRRCATYGGALAMFALSLLCKVSFVMLPGVLLLMSGWVADARPAPGGHYTWRQTWRPLLPFFALALVFGLVGLSYRGTVAAGQLMPRADGFWSRLCLAARAVWFYLGKTLWPEPLAFIYPRWSTTELGLESIVAFGLLVGVAGGLAAAARRWPSARALLAITGTALLLLLPCLGFVNISYMRDSLVADHWQYLALAAWLLIVVQVAVAAALQAVQRFGWRASLVHRLGQGTLAILLGLAIWRSREQGRIYQSELTLWEATVAANPAAFVAHNNLALAYQRLGRLDEAVTEFAAAAALRPDLSDVWWINEGQLRERQGRLSEALELYRRAVAAAPHSAAANYSLAHALVDRGELTAATTYYRAAIAVQPDFAAAHYNLGLILERTGDRPAALAEIRQALQFDPDFAAAHNGLGALLLMDGQRDEAAREFRSAAKLQPDNPEVRRNLQLLETP